MRALKLLPLICFLFVLDLEAQATNENKREITYSGCIIADTFWYQNLELLPIPSVEVVHKRQLLGVPQHNQAEESYRISVFEIHMIKVIPQLGTIIATMFWLVIVIAHVVGKYKKQAVIVVGGMVLFCGLLFSITYTWPLAHLFFYMIVVTFISLFVVTLIFWKNFRKNLI